MFSNIIKDLRKKEKYTQAELAAKLSVNQTTVSCWETGKATPPPEMLMTLAQFFGVTVDYLMGNAPAKPEKKKGVQIPVLGEVRAGYPMEAVENIIDYEEIDEEMARRGEFFALRIKGDSMEPRFVEGEVRAGYPMEAVENIIDYEEIDEEMARRGEFFALRIKGDSMEPRFVEGDVVIVRKQETADSGDIVVALVNGDSATIKKLKRHQNGITLVPSNAAYEPMYYSSEEIMELPVNILGKVVELRAKF